MMTVLSPLQSFSFLYQDKPARVHRAAISPDGARVAAASYFELAAWTVGEQEASWRVAERSNTRTVHTSALAWSADGQHVLAAHDGVLTRYDAVSGQVISQRPMPISGVSALVWSPDGARYLAPHRLLYVCDAATDAALFHISGPKSFSQVAFSADGTRIVAVGEKSLWVFDASDGSLIARYPYARFGVMGLALGGDGARAWVTEAGDAAVCLQLGKKTKKVLGKIAGDDVAAGGCAAVWRDGSAFVLASERGVSLHRFEDGATLAHAPRWEWAYCDALDVARDADRFVTAHVCGEARVWAVDVAAMAQGA